MILACVSLDSYTRTEVYNLLNSTQLGRFIKHLVSSIDVIPLIDCVRRTFFLIRRVVSNAMIARVKVCLGKVV